MIPFLKQVAQEYYRRENLENICFIFPNRRSMVFFKKYLASANIRPQARPMVMPRTCTVNDFLGSLYAGVQPDKVTLLLELYDCYSQVNPSAESLDEFVFWGDVLLSDFNDVDKYMVDTHQLFTNISDYKSLQDSFSYLTDKQREALENFFGHFVGKPVNVEGAKKNVKEDFLRIWNLLHPLYELFRDSLEKKGWAYEGMIYRSVAERMKDEGPQAVLENGFRDTELFVFVGLNALNECEKTILRKLRGAHLAEFCWDYQGDMIQDSYNRSSKFLSENVREFPQAIDFEPVTGKPEIEVIDVASNIGQAKQLPGIFREIAVADCGSDLSRVGVLEDDATGDCAVVLPDENLLMPVLNSIPPEIGHINVTMGYPMSCSTFYAFMSHVAGLQLNVRVKDGKPYFYHKFLSQVFADGIFKAVAGDDALALVDAVKARAELYVSPEALSATPFLSTLFKAVVSDYEPQAKGPEEARAEEEGTRREAVGGPLQSPSPATQPDSAAAIYRLSAYLLEVAESTARRLKAKGGEGMELEFAKAYIDHLKAIGRKHLAVKPKTWIHLLDQLLSNVAVPFKGEPLRGLQIMGPLETRALDFHNVIILSSNEGVFPRRSVANSFIPPELRRGFDLPTYEYQDSVWAYYFYRLLSRAKKVWMIYDSRTEGLISGEESRYIKQLEYHFGLDIKRRSVKASLTGIVEESIPKTAEDVAIIEKLTFSASSVQTYLSCPVKFYYQYVRKLRPENEINENLDSAMIGTVYHAVMQALYTGEKAMDADFDPEDKRAVAAIGPGLRYIDKAYIRSWQKKEDVIRTKIHRLIMKELHSLDVAGRNLVTADVILRYVKKTLETDLALMDQYGVDRFEILGLERNFSMEMEDFELNDEIHKGFSFKGIVDRLDCFKPGEIRIVDYKTGKVDDKEKKVSDSEAQKVADELFDPDKLDKKKIALQLYVYDKMLHAQGEYAGKTIVNCIYSVSGLFSSLPENADISPKFITAVDGKMEEMMKELVNIDIPFRRVKDVPKNGCEYCDFKSICGR